ncbi:membrane protein [Hominimerdicola sp. 21CYCFAH17_S]
MILTKQKTAPCLLSAAAILYCVLLIINAEAVTDGITESIFRCINIIVPSLFAFMAVSGVIIKSRIYSYISKPFHFFSKYILNVPDNLFFIFILGNISGYPIGIKLLSDMVKEEKIPPRTAEIMSCYCYAGGPAFLTGAVGLAVFGSKKVGLLMFLSILTANFLVGMVMNRIFKLKCLDSGNSFVFKPETVINSITEAGRSLFVMCALIVFFSTIMSVLDSCNVFGLLADNFNITDNGSVLIKSFLEISSVTRITGAPYRLIPLITSICGFGGICVILQIIAVNQNSFSLRMFFLTRGICFIIQYFVSLFIFMLFNNKYVAASAAQTEIIVDFNNFVPSICLIMMIFLLVLRKD